MPADALLQDLKHGVRQIVQDRWLTTAAVVALALGLGVSTTIMTVMYGLNLRALPFDRPAALVDVGVDGGDTTYALFDRWRSARSATAVAAHAGAPINLRDDVQATDQVAGTFVSHSTFGLLGIQPILGRDFVEGDDRAGAPAVAIISHAIWTDRYGGDRGAVGRTLHLNGAPVTVVGVMPPGFRFPVSSDLWLPLAAMPAAHAPSAAARPVSVIARLAEGVTVQQASAEFTAIAAPLNERNHWRRVAVVPLNEGFVGSMTEPAPLMIMAAALLVVVIACSHAANLLLVRSMARARDVSLRLALGASRARIVRQLLIESALMGAMAGLIGLGAASFGVSWFANETRDFNLPYWIRFTLDARLFAWLACFSVGAGIAFGLLPAAHLARTDLTSVLNQAGRGTTPRANRLMGGLLVGQLAVTVILLNSAALLTQSARVLQRADSAIDLPNVWEMRLALPEDSYGSLEKRQLLYRQLDERLGSLAGAEAAALSSAAPFVGSPSRTVLTGGQQAQDNERRRTTRVVGIGARYFDVLGLKLRRGTEWDRLDASSSPHSVLVNDPFVSAFFPGGDPIGRQIRLADAAAPGAPPPLLTVVGVVPPVRQSVARDEEPVAYVPHGIDPGLRASVLVRGNPAVFAPALREAVRTLDPNLPVYGLQTLERLSEKSRWMQRATSTLLTAFAVVAVFLSALGMYALTAYNAARRAQEIGIRMALGARPFQAWSLVLRRALVHLGVGLTLGLGGALLAATALRGVLVRIRPTDVPTLLSVALLLVVITGLASFLPARRAAHTDPLEVLRTE
ncbi:MAG TPA: ADOP family duplicated permease [Vicinamibacterales bacterium]|nr:ADOP family duplicated permease [Vicinamibacterales bacterium]